MNQQSQPSLRRAVLLAAACVLALGTAAFWPAPHWVTPGRPPLKAPIVFDELENFRNLAADTNATPRAP